MLSPVEIAMPIRIARGRKLPEHAVTPARPSDGYGALARPRGGTDDKTFFRAAPR